MLPDSIVFIPHINTSTSASKVTYVYYGLRCILIFFFAFSYSIFILLYDEEKLKYSFNRLQSQASGEQRSEDSARGDYLEHLQRLAVSSDHGIHLLGSRLEQCLVLLADVLELSLEAGGQKLPSTTPASGPASTGTSSGTGPVQRTGEGRALLVHWWAGLPSVGDEADRWLLDALRVLSAAANVFLLSRAHLRPPSHSSSEAECRKGESCWPTIALQPLLSAAVFCLRHPLFRAVLDYPDASRSLISLPPLLVAGRQSFLILNALLAEVYLVRF